MSESELVGWLNKRTDKENEYGGKEFSSINVGM